MAPEWGIVPLAILATMATVIASQALISGAFSLTAQAVKLDYFPRLAIRHTSSRQMGQVYVPLVNWALMVGCILLVVTFRSSSALASAYGIAVTTTMLITSLIFFRVVRDRWGWSAPKAIIVMIPFFLVDIAFLAANVPKIPTGGWFPLLVGVALVAQMTTWRRGRQLVARRIRRGETPIKQFAEAAVGDGVTRVRGTAVYLFKDAGVAPPALVANLKHNKVLHEMTILVSVEVEDVPRVAIRKRARYTHLADGVIQVRMHFGFMDDPDVPAALTSLKMPHYEFDAATASYFIGRESVTSGKVPGMHPLREQLFVLLNRGAANASRFFHLPPDQVFEVGTQVVI
jgi:KUP system potassium uptake protein